MANPDALKQQNAAKRVLQPTVKSHLAFTLLSALIMMLMFTLLRVALLVYTILSKHALTQEQHHGFDV